jgi:hypothetical protein
MTSTNENPDGRGTAVRAGRVTGNYASAGPASNTARPRSKARSDWVERARLVDIAAAEFVKSIVSPDYLIDGLLQRHMIYSLTGRTGHGKTSIALLFCMSVVLGRKLGDRDVEKGKVVYFAGENADNTGLLWIRLCEEMKVKEPEKLDNIQFLRGSPNISSEEIRKQIEHDVNLLGGADLVIVDTSPRFFQGEDESSRKQQLDHAIMLRSLTELRGKPTVLALCHPVKGATQDNLLPAGGGTFLNELDGGLTCWLDRNTDTIEFHWQGKFRGPEFLPVYFKVSRHWGGEHEKLKDKNGRLLATATVMLISTSKQEELEELEELEEKLMEEQLNVLWVMVQTPGISMSKIAERLGWFMDNKDKEPYKMKVDRIIKDLAQQKHVEKVGNSYYVTAKGRKAAKEPRSADEGPPPEPPQSEIPF